VKIDSYHFGEMVIEGKRYTADVIIFPERVQAHWWRAEGHELAPGDLDTVIEAKPEVLVVGTGNPGYMRVLPETETYLHQQGIRLLAEPTAQAWQTYNRLASGTTKVVASFHLTC